MAFGISKLEGCDVQFSIENVQQYGRLDFLICVFSSTAVELWDVSSCLYLVPARYCLVACLKLLQKRREKTRKEGKKARQNSQQQSTVIDRPTKAKQNTFVSFAPKLSLPFSPVE